MKQGISIGAALIAMSILVAGAPATAAPTGLGGMISEQKQTHHRTNWISVVRHKVMGMVAAAEGGMKMKAAMAAKAGMAAKAAQAAQAAKAKQASIGQAPIDSSAGGNLSVAR